MWIHRSQGTLSYMSCRLLDCYNGLDNYFGFIIQVWQSFYELLEMHKHTLDMNDILEVLEALCAANFSNTEKIVKLLISRAADVIECGRSIEKLDVVS